MSRHAYLDYNATCPIRDRVIAAVAEAMALVGNPSSVHGPGRDARGLVERARNQVAALVGARPRDVIFTSGGTEANNAALRGAGASRLIISAVEHDCVFAASDASGLETLKAPVDASGQIDLAALADLIDQGEASKTLVSIMAANNETGVVHDLNAISDLVAQKGARLHTDAVQMAGKLAFDITEIKADYITLSAHKIGGPQGVGALITAPTAPLKPLIAGGGQELGRRSGTENVAGIVGFGVACEEAARDVGRAAEISALRDALEAGVRETFPDVTIFGHNSPRLPGTSCIHMPGVKGETQVMHMDLSGVAISSGSACSSGKVKVSHVLSAMGADADTAGQTIRVSLGYGSSADDVDRFLSAWRKLFERSAQA